MKRFWVVFVALMVLSPISASAQDQPREKLYRFSQVAFSGAAIADLISTGWIMTHPVDVSYHYCFNGSSDCRIVNDSAVFMENGWPYRMGVNPRSPAKVLIALAVGDVAVLAVSHLLSKKGGKWRTVAVVVNSLVAVGHFRSATNNVKLFSETKRTIVPLGAFNVQW